jgi:hypothetical protein
MRPHDDRVLNKPEETAAVLDHDGFSRPATSVS